MQQRAQTPEDTQAVTDATASDERQPEVAKEAKTQLAILWPAMIMLVVAVAVILFFVFR